MRARPTIVTWVVLMILVAWQIEGPPPAELSELS